MLLKVHYSHLTIKALKSRLNFKLISLLDNDKREDTVAEQHELIINIFQESLVIFLKLANL